MASECSTSTRRYVLKATVAILCCAGAKVKIANAATSKTVDQITDPMTTAAKNMFRFEPDFVNLSPGDELTFLNSQAQHTVHSVPELWPDGVPLVRIANQKELTVQFEREGFYGLRCKRHGQYGMVMLVVVGNPGGAQKLREKIDTMRAKARERAGFANLLDRFERA